MVTKKEKMILMGRSQLKKYFKNGTVPVENHFSFLIDSMANKLDDGFSKDEDHGLMIAPTGRSEKLISFFDSIDEKSPAWYIEKGTKENPGLSIGEGDGESRLFIQNGGNVGIGTMKPNHKLDVDGFVGMKGRVGTFLSGEVPANGRWHTIAGDLNHAQGFEVIARVGQKTSGRHAILHAFAFSTFGDSWQAIRRSSAFYRFFWHKISIRFSGSTFNYQLQVKTFMNYGEDEDGRDIMIRFYITKLWDDETFLPVNELYIRQ
jgi:hypothetical protein